MIGGHSSVLEIASKFGVELVADELIAQERTTFFGGKDQMEINGGERLGHNFGHGCRNPVGVGGLFGRLTQGSRVATTLGWRAKSRWDLIRWWLRAQGKFRVPAADIRNHEQLSEGSRPSGSTL